MAAKQKAVRRRKQPKQPALADLVKFRFPEAWLQFEQTYFIGKGDIPIIWKDLMRYLWLTGVDREGNLLEPPRIIDEMWHTFLNYTREYRAWCDKYFGAFVDHIPKTSKQILAERNLAGQDDPATRAHVVESITRVWNHFGEKTALRWYVTYPTTFDSEFFDRRRPGPVDIKIPQALLDRAKRT